jgi:hypothetical protein
MVPDLIQAYLHKEPSKCPNYDCCNHFADVKVHEQIIIIRVEVFCTTGLMVSKVLRRSDRFAYSSSGGWVILVR